jgi:hypothetical protein
MRRRLPLLRFARASLLAGFCALVACARATQPAADTLRLVSGADPPGLNPLVFDNAAGDREITSRLVERSDLLFLGFTREGVAFRDDIAGIVPAVTGTHLWNVWAWHRVR